MQSNNKTSDSTPRRINNSVTALKPAETTDEAHNSNRGNCIPLVSCGGLIRSGDFVRHQVPGHHQELLVGQVIAMTDLGKIPSAERRACVDAGGNGDDRMVLIRHFKIPGSNSKVPRPNPTDYPNTPSTLKEAIQTNNVEWIRVENVWTIAFVFHIKEINSGVTNCAGMRNAFFISHKMAGSKRKEMTVEEFDPWHCPCNQQFYDSFRKQVWCAFVSLKCEVFKAMSTGGKWDGRTKSAKLGGISMSIWGFIYSEIQQICAEQDIISCSFKGGRARKQPFPNLSVCNRRLKHHIDMIRAMDECEMDAFRQLLGCDFAVGVTKSAPSIRAIKEAKSNGVRLDDTVYLENHDEVRIASCVRDLSDLDPKKEKRVRPDNIGSNGDRNQDPRDPKRQKLLCSYRGIDAKYTQLANGVTELAFQLRFLRAPAMSKIVRKAQNGGTHVELTDNPIAPVPVEVPIAVGASLRHEGVVYEVISVEDNGMVQCQEFGEEETIMLEMAEATLAFNSYLNN